MEDSTTSWFPSEAATQPGGPGELSRGFISVHPGAPGTGGQSYQGHKVASLPPKGQDRLLGWKEAAASCPRPVPAAQPRVSHLCVSPARPCGAQDAFAFADICSCPSRTEPRAPSLSQEAAEGESASQTGRKEDPCRSRPHWLWALPSGSSSLFPAYCLQAGSCSYPENE